MKANLKKLPKLFLSSFLISAVTFGGGYVIVTFFKKKYVDEYKWIDEKEMLDLIAIAQASPGAIAVNGAIITGYKICGVLGAAVAVLATILPPFIIIAAVSVAYNAFKDNRVVAAMLQGMQAGVAAVIASVSYDMAVDVFKEKSPSSIIIMAGAFAASCFFNVNAVYIVLACIAIGICKALWQRRRKKNDLF